MTVLVGHKLLSSDVRMLACRADPDPSVESCWKQLACAGGQHFWLCPKRLAVFVSKEGGSLAGLRCDDVEEGR